MTTEKPPPLPPWNDPEAAVPESIPEDPSTRPMAIPVLDERTFVTECCARLNAFLLAAPLEAQNVLKTFLPYRHELVEPHRRRQSKASTMARRISSEIDVDLEPPAGAPVAALFAGILQTRHGDGFYIRPVFVPDPDDPGGHALLGFEVVAQDVKHPEKT